MIEQIQFFFADYRRICGAQKARYFYVWMNRISVGIFLYRFERSLFLTFGKGWKVCRIILSPLLNLLYAYSNCEIHYEADIGPGISIHHASIGVVISGRSRIGRNLTMVGGNVIGIRDEKKGELSIGDNCSMGANAVILGPVVLGNNTTIGACALVVRNSPGDETLIGVPAVAAASA